jgi:hypothetical protein
MKIVYNKRAYEVAFITHNDVVVNLPEDMIYGHVSRTNITFSRLSKNQAKRLRNSAFNASDI